MKRREVIVQLGGVLLALPAARVLLGCSGDDPGNGGGGADGGDPDAGTTQSLSFVSSLDSGHTHRVSLAVSEIEDSPAGGVTKDTSASGSHTHRVTLTEADLDSIDQGNTVEKTTTFDSGHTHTFSFHKA